jgi:hypothetical protein
MDEVATLRNRLSEQSRRTEGLRTTAAAEHSRYARVLPTHK